MNSESLIHSHLKNETDKENEIRKLSEIPKISKRDIFLKKKFTNLDDMEDFMLEPKVECNDGFVNKDQVNQIHLKSIKNKKQNLPYDNRSCNLSDEELIMYKNLMPNISPQRQSKLINNRQENNENISKPRRLISNSIRNISDLHYSIKVGNNELFLQNSPLLLKLMQRNSKFNNNRTNQSLR